MRNNKYLIKKFSYITKNYGFFSALKKTVKYLYSIRKDNYLNDSRVLDCGPIDHYPLVSLIAVNYNGEKDLPSFLDSIMNQTYKNFELIIVDNCSTDNSKNIIKEYQKKFSKIQYIELEKNLGFAAGNNYAMPYCNGEFYGLINVDTIVDKDWLKELVDAISIDGTCGAVCSKTLFFERFQDVEIKTCKEFKVNINCLVSSLNYKKYFVRHGKIQDNFINSINKKIILSLPVQNDKIVLNLSGLNNCELVSIKIGKKKSNFYSITNHEIMININFNENDVINSSYIINNAGSVSIGNMPADRGIGEYDMGQYDNKQYVDFFCGVSVLIRRSIIPDRKIFVSEFFAYYEDSELSRYIRKLGYKILYVPRSIVYHKHSATSSEDSPLWNLLVSRSQKIYNYNSNNSNPVKLFEEINHIEEYYKKDINQNIYNELKTFSKTLLNRLLETNDIVERLKPIAIYNSYWNTKGGGESHALSFAEVLQKYETVYLVSEEDFSIEELSDYYGLDLSNCRKIVQGKITSSFTERFNVFINSTYASNLISKSRHSYYIVSFPHKNVTNNFLKSYTFLYNSDYTKLWAEKYWGKNLKSEIIYPLGNLKQHKMSIIEKEKIILNVGRFFVGDHCKNQLEIAKAFKKFSLKYKDSGWQLVLIGSIDQSNPEALNYYNSIKEELKGLNYKIILNASREILNDYYKRSYIYVHATGLGKNKQENPEQFEHFGITPVEAMSYGCIPIVYNIGGPAELIKKLHVGYTFNNLEDLIYKLVQVTENYDNQKNKLSQQILFTINNFLNKNDFENRLQFIIKNMNNTRKM